MTVTSQLRASLSRPRRWPGDQQAAEDNHRTGREPWPVSREASEGVAGKQHHRHRDGVRYPERNLCVLHEEEWHDDRNGRDEDEQKDRQRADPVFRLESRSARLGSGIFNSPA